MRCCFFAAGEHTPLFLYTIPLLQDRTDVRSYSLFPLFFILIEALFWLCQSSVAVLFGKAAGLSHGGDQFSLIHRSFSSYSCIFRWYNAIIQDIRQNSNLRLIFQARRRKRLRHPCPRHAFCAHSNKQLQLVLLKKSRQHANLFPCYWQNATRCVGSISSF